VEQHEVEGRRLSHIVATFFGSGHISAGIFARLISDERQLLMVIHRLPDCLMRPWVDSSWGKEVSS
jgi:hypothetical protein